MKKFLQGNIYNPTLGNISLNQAIEEIIKYMLEKQDYSYNVIIGCDSSSSQEPCFPIAIVVLRKGDGGRFFLKKIKYKKIYYWKQRVLEEVLLSCELALFLREEIRNRIKQMSVFIDYQFRYIHADVGENGKTKDMIKEVVGLIHSNGFEAKIKPEAYAASVVADRFT